MISACDSTDGDIKSKNIDNPDPTQKTTIVFDNTQGTCTAVVYSYFNRTEDEKIVEVPAGQLSNEFEWNSGSSVPFFFSYKLNLVGINDFEIDYVARESSRDQVYIRVDKDKKTVIPIPALADTLSSPGISLSNNSYIFIQNNSSFSISLSRGSAGLTPDNFSDTNVNPGERAHYTIKSNDLKTVSSYQIRENLDYSSFPPSLGSFEPGKVYCFIYNNGSLSLFTVIDIKLANVVTGSINDPSNKTYVRFINNNDFSVRVYTNFARNNKITDAPALSRSGAVQTDPNLSGAVFYPNYNIVIEGVTIPYQGDLIVTRIDIGKTAEQPNTVTIPLLEHLDESEFEKPLSNFAYIKIQNDASLSLSFRQGTSDLIPQGAMSTIVNEGETALYIVNAGNTSNYSFRRNTVTPISFPNDVTQFESGKLYSFRFDGIALVLLTEKPLTLKQAFSLSPPENITARTRPSGSIVLSWNKVGIESSYKIYRAEENPDNFVYINSTVNTTYTDDNVLLGNTYYYKLVSVKNTMESGMSENYVSVLSEITSLSAPSGLTAVVQGHDSILLSWNSAEDASTYMIYRGYSSGNINTYVTTTSSVSYLVTALEEYTGYWFTVSAANSNSESYPSEAVYGQTYLNVPPEPPTGLNATTLNNNILVLWNNVTGVTGYKVYRSTSESGTYYLAGNVSSSPFTDSGLTPNTTYYYKVSSVRGTQESGLSETVNVKLIQTITPQGNSLAEQLAWIATQSPDGATYEITVSNDVYLAPTSISTMGRNVIVNIRGESSTNVRTIQLEGNGHLFSVDTNITLRLQDVVLKGHSMNNKALVGVGTGGTLILNSGSGVIGNTNIADWGLGAGVYVNGGQLEMNEGSGIIGNSASSSGSSFYSGIYGGGLQIENGATVFIRGGIISENVSRSPLYNGGYGGGMYIRGNSTVTMTGGIISKNRVEGYRGAGGQGGGIFVVNGSSFIKRAAPGSSTSGIIYGGTGDDANTSEYNLGNAIYRNFGTLKSRNTTLGGYDEISTWSDLGWE